MSGNVVESGSSKTVAASRKSTPCALRFSSALFGSQVNFTTSLYALFDRYGMAASNVPNEPRATTIPAARRLHSDVSGRLEISTLNDEMSVPFCAARRIDKVDLKRFVPDKQD